jgi:hypothetical protein
VIVGLVDVGGLVDHHCLEVIVGFVDVEIGRATSWMASTGTKMWWSKRLKKQF